MNKKEHLLVCLSEECAEVIHRVSKALRFGLDEIQQGETENNLALIGNELSDVLAMVEMLRDEGVDLHPLFTTKIDLKIAKVNKWMVHAKTQGTLEK